MLLAFAASSASLPVSAASATSLAESGDHEIIEVENQNCTFRVISTARGEHEYWSAYPPSGDEALYAAMARHTPGRVALDIGGWIGPTALFLACFADHVVVVEPVREAWGQLLLNLQLTPQFESRVTLARSALGATFDVQHFSTTGSSMDKPLRFHGERLR